MIGMPDLVHLHFLLNHFPSVGLLVGLGIFVIVLIAKSDHLRQMSLVVFAIIALIGFPAYVSGNIAAQAVEKVPGVAKEAINAHEGMALVSLMVLELLGAVAWIGLWQHRRFGKTPSGVLTAVLIIGFVTFALMAQTSNIGGEIRHPEILAQGAPPGASIGPFAREFSLAFKSLPWGWAAAETVHFIGLCLIMGVTLLLDMRMLGAMKSVSFAALHRLLPWGIFGFTLNTITGMFFFSASPGQYIQTTANAELFLLKMMFVVVAGLNALYFTVLDQPWKVAAGQDAPGTAKLFAASAIVLWLGVIYCGSMLPFIGGAF